MQNSYQPQPQPMQPIQPMPPIQPMQQPVVPTPATPPKKSKRGLIIAIIALVAVALIAAIIIILLSLSGDKMTPATPSDDGEDSAVTILDDYITLTADGKNFVLYDTFGETFEAAIKTNRLYRRNEDFEYVLIKEGDKVEDLVNIMAEDGKTYIAGFSANTSYSDNPAVVYSEADARFFLGTSGKYKFAIDGHKFVTNETVIDEYVKSFDEVTPPSGDESEYGILYTIHYKGHTMLFAFSQSDRTISAVVIYKDHPFISEGKKLEDININFNGETFTLSESFGNTLRSAFKNCKNHYLYLKKRDNVTVDNLESYLKEPYSPAQQAFVFAGGDGSYLYTMNYTEMPPETISTRGDAKANAFFRLAKSMNMEMTIDGHKITPGVTTEKDLKWIDGLTATYKDTSFVGKYKNRYVYIRLDKTTSEKLIEIEFKVTPTGTF